MQNVQQLLDELGSPPTEVCLDWAWQLVHLSTQPDCPSSLGWFNLRISRHGSLAFACQKTQSRPQSTSTTKDTHELIHCLLKWAGLDERKLSGIDTLDECRSALESLTGQCVNGQSRSITLPLDSRSVEAREAHLTDPVDSTLDIGAAHQEPALSLGLAEESSQQLETIALESPSTQQSSNERRWKRTAKAKSRILNNRPLLLAVSSAAAVLALTTAYFVMAGNAKSDAIATKDSKTTSGTSGLSKPSDSSSKPKTNSTRSKSSGTELDELLSGSGSGSVASGSVDSTNEPPEITTTLEITTFDIERKSETGRSQIEGTSSAAESLGSITTNSRIQDDGSNLSSRDASKTPNEYVASASNQTMTVEAKAAIAASNESVAGLLKSVTSDDTKVNTLNAGDDQDGPPKLPVQLLNVESMFQVQELPARIRVRQPVWQLRIASTTAFTVDPPGLQSLAEKETVRWILTAKELKPRKGQEPTQVVVLAQLTGRKADIRWTVAAGSQDTPGIAVPLNESTLDQMLTVLQGYQQRLTMGVDQIKATVEAVEIPREQKSLLSAQRRAMENEGKLVTRARQLIADASMFAGWMDRSLEVHGVLMDQIGGQPTVVLELGQPIVADSKLKDDDSNDVAPAEHDKEPADKK